MRAIWVIVTLAAALLVPLGAACGGESDDERAVAQALADTYTAEEANDVEAFLALVTDNYLADFFVPPPTRDQLRDSGVRVRGSPPNVLSDVGDVRVSGDSATAVAWLRTARGAVRLTYDLVKQGGAWLVDGATLLRVDTPDGATEAAVELVDSRYLFANDRDTFPAGDLAIQAANDGTQPHDLFVFKLPEGVSVQDSYEVNDPAEVGAEYIGLFGAVEPGAGGTWLLDDLEPGRYGYFCWVPDQLSGAPHAFDGMSGEFTVE